MNAADLDAIDLAVHAVSHRLEPEDRFDLRQDLSERLLKKKARPRSVAAWAQWMAQNWCIDLARDQKKRTEVEGSAGATRKRLGGPNWEPTWYPPHPDAVEGAWLACSGARLIHVKPGQVECTDMQAIYAELLDAKRKRHGKQK